MVSESREVFSVRIIFILFVVKNAAFLFLLFFFFFFVFVFVVSNFPRSYIRNTHNVMWMVARQRCCMYLVLYNNEIAFINMSVVHWQRTVIHRELYKANVLVFVNCAATRDSHFYLLVSFFTCKSHAVVYLRMCGNEMEYTNLWVSAKWKKQFKWNSYMVRSGIA